VKPISRAALSRTLEERAILSERELTDRFVAALRDLKAEPHPVATRDATRETLRSIVDGHQGHRVVVANLPPEVRTLVAAALKGLSVQLLEDLPPKDVVGACAAAEVGITWADFAIADDGAVVEVAHDDAARLAASLPIVHVILLPRGRLVQDVGEAMAVAGGILRESGPGGRPTITFVSGPSRTGDIELRLLYGVHGPHSLHVLLLDWYEGR
jgi:L-lactate dehydrogenase complex protein LldG